MFVTYFVNFRQLNDHLFWKELFIRFAASAFRKLPSVYTFSYFPFGFEGRMWDLIVSVSDHCLSFYFPLRLLTPSRTIFRTVNILHEKDTKLEQMFYDSRKGNTKSCIFFNIQ